MNARLKSVAYHYRLLLEPLEQRRLLTTIIGVDPVENSHDAPVTTDVSAVFDEDINPATISAQSFAVHGMQTGQVLDSYSVSGDTVTLSPDAPFHPGELVQATATTGIESSGGEPVNASTVWQFRTATSGGLGIFGDSGRNLGHLYTTAVALGDLDGDSDLDAFVGHIGRPNKVWLNDGSGNFTDGGQHLGDSSTLAVALGDLDGDGDLDAFVGNSRRSSREPSNKVWLNDGSGLFTDSGQNLGNSGSSAVVLRDVDGDGDLDAFVGNGHGEPNKIWLNDGSGIFADSGQGLGNSRAWAVALGDLDGDGDLDAFVGDASSDQANRVWLNDGSGTFTDSGQNLGDSRTGAVVLGDVDSDGDLDAFIGIAGAPNEVWLNDGSGIFADSGQDLGNSGTPEVALGDLDGDGDLDAFVTGFQSESEAVWLNDGSGNFTDSGQNLEDSTTAVALGDLDGDGDLDAVVGYYWAVKPITVVLNADIRADLSVTSSSQHLLMPGQFVTYTITVTNHGPESVAGANVTNIFPVEINDVSWTGIASAGASCTGSGTGNISDTVSLPAGGTVSYTATGQLSFTATGAITNVATVTALTGADDLRPTNNISRDTNVVLPLDPTPLPGSHTALVDTDVSVTYDEDVAPASVAAETYAVHGMQTGQILNSFSVDGDTVTLSPDAPFHPGEPVQVTLTTGIENVGGDPLAAPFVWQFRTAANGGTGRFVDSGQSLGDSGTSAVALGDVDADGDLDAFVGNFHHSATGSRANKVWLNDGNGNFSDSEQSLGDSRTRAVALGDLDGDGDLDAFVANDSREPNRVWLNDGNGNFTDSGQGLGDSWTYAVALGDVDGDGDLDAFVGNGYYGNKVWLNDGSGTFTDSGQSLDQAHTYAVALGDVDGDGDLDAFVGDGYFYRRGDPSRVWLNDGGGNFTDSGQLLGEGAHDVAVALGDMDGDGDLDAFFGSLSGSRAIFMNDGSGDFTESRPLPGNGDIHDAALGDVDGDGDLDAIVGIGWGDLNKIWLNDGSGNFTDSGQTLVNSANSAVALGDLDGDGDLDAFIGRHDQPNKVWLNQDPVPGDFDNDQDVDGNDFQIWQNGFGIQSGATRYDGDADFDGDVDGNDFLIWQTNYDVGTTAGQASAAPAATNSNFDRPQISSSRLDAVDKTFAERDRASLWWAKWSLRDELITERTLLK